MIGGTTQGLGVIDLLPFLEIKTKLKMKAN